jgi:hypothetical protein
MADDKPTPPAHSDVDLLRVLASQIDPSNAGGHQVAQAWLEDNQPEDASADESDNKKSDDKSPSKPATGAGPKKG